MAKTRAELACRGCGHRVGQWAGRCPSCGEWGSIEEGIRASARMSVMTLTEDGGPEPRLSTGFEGVDRVLGGGVVPGSVVLVAGEPGIGKSTLLLQVAARVAGRDHAVLYASGEESQAQVAARARRLGIDGETVSYLPGRDLNEVLASARAAGPSVLVVDSIQAVRDADLPSLPGGAAQVRAATDALVGLAKSERISVILAGQVTKDGEVAGPRTLEHAVDVVCSFDGDSRTGLRVLAGGKNRFGPEGEVAWFEMDPAGLREVDPAQVLAPSAGEPGAATALVSAGRRALAVEVQALIVPTEGSPRRHVSGLDPRRFGVIAAVLDRVAGIKVSRAEVYGATSGGLRIEEPGADLAIAAAIVSAARAKAPPKNSAFVGEVTLTGAVRSAPNLTGRLAAAAAHGIRTVYCGGTTEAPPGVHVADVKHVGDALSWALK